MLPLNTPQQAPVHHNIQLNNIIHHFLITSLFIIFSPSPQFTVLFTFFTPCLHVSLIFIYSMSYLVLNYLLNLS